jgi:hypothetical protein
MKDLHLNKKHHTIETAAYHIEIELSCQIITLMDTKLHNKCTGSGLECEELGKDSLLG